MISTRSLRSLALIKEKDRPVGALQKESFAPSARTEPRARCLPYYVGEADCNLAISTVTISTDSKNSYDYNP